MRVWFGSPPVPGVWVPVLYAELRPLPGIYIELLLAFCSVSRFGLGVITALP